MKIELLRLKERIEIASEMGESHFREFKSGFEGPNNDKKPRQIKDICQNISKTLVAFANADGGELIVGAEDDGEITGLDFKEDLLKVIMDAPKTYVHSTTPLPATKSQIVEFENKKVAYFSVPKGTEHVYITSDGKCLKRKDLESIPVSPESIQVERSEKKSREYDRGFVDGADITDLDFELLTYASKEFSKTISEEKFLQHLDLAEFDGTKLRLRMAALLLFAKQPHKWHPRLQVRILKVKGNEVKSGKDFNVINDNEISANILRLVDGSWDSLRPHLTETKFSTDAIFKAQVVYPELACREALINAIAHRDYSIEGRGIEIFVFDDRLEIKSPGTLLSSVTVADLENRTGIHQSRNTYVARVLKEVGYMRELGEGFRRIYDLMESNDLTKPTLLSAEKSFKVTLSQKLVYSTEEQFWLENFENLNLTRDEKTIIRLGAKGELISPKLIWDSVGIIDTDVYRQLIESLRQKGLLISEISKPEALKIARKERITDKKAIPRFKIIAPDQTISEQKEIKKIKISTIKNLDNSAYSKIFIENIPFDCTDEQIEEVFGKYGSIDSIRIPKNYYTGNGRGFAYIEFEKTEASEKALEDKFNIFMGKRKIIVKTFTPRKASR